jgi:hypothetical protein
MILAFSADLEALHADKVDLAQCVSDLESAVGDLIRNSLPRHQYQALSNLEVARIEKIESAVARLTVAVPSAGEVRPSKASCDVVAADNVTLALEQLRADYEHDRRLLYSRMEECSRIPELEKLLAAMTEERDELKAAMIEKLKRLNAVRAALGS